MGLFEILLKLLSWDLKITEMKQINLLGMMVIAGAFIACEKDLPEKGVVLQDVEFVIRQVDELDLKEAGYNFDCSQQMEPVYASVEIEGFEKPLILIIYSMEGQLYTQRFKVAIRPDQPTEFRVKNFTIRDVNNQTIMAIPREGALLADYVANPVQFGFQVSTAEIKQVPVEVLCFSTQYSADFGY